VSEALFDNQTVSVGVSVANTAATPTSILWTTDVHGLTVAQTGDALTATVAGQPTIEGPVILTATITMSGGTTLVATAEVDITAAPVPAPSATIVFGVPTPAN